MGETNIYKLFIAYKSLYMTTLMINRFMTTYKCGHKYVYDIYDKYVYGIYDTYDIS